MSKFNFDRVIRNMDEINRVIPTELANIAQNDFVQNFQRQSFDGDKWKEVNRRIKGTKEYKYPKKKRLSRRTKPILIESGNMRRKTSSMIRQVMKKKVRMVLDLPYAAAQNYGTDNIAARPFVGQTRELTAKQKAHINKRIEGIWQA